jgi:hypothetical protein
MKPHVVRVTATFEFVGILPAGGSHSTPEEAVKQKFRMLDVGISGFVCEGKNLVVRTKEVELPDMP